MGFGNIFLPSLSGTRARERLLLFRVAIPGFAFVILWVVDSRFSAVRNAEQVGSSLAEETLIKAMTQWTLAFSDSSLHRTLTNPAENNFFTLLRQLLWRHGAELQLHLRRWKTTFDLRQPVPIS